LRKDLSHTPLEELPFKIQAFNDFPLKHPDPLGQRLDLERMKDGSAGWSGGGKLGQMDLGGKGASAHWGNTFQKQLQGIN